MARPIVIGLTWKRMKNELKEEDELDVYQSPITRSQSRTSQRSESGDLKERVLTRVRSVRASIGGLGESFGTLRQKFKKSTMRRKRLNNAMSPKTPTPSKAKAAARRRTIVGSTPSRENTQELQMYSPFCIDTPSRTPSKIKMGTKSKRINMSSPGTFQTDLETISESMRTLSQISENIGQTRRARRSSMGVSSLTPQKGTRPKAIFV